MGLASLFLRFLAPAILAVCLIAASSCTPAETKSLTLEQPETVDNILSLQVTPLRTIVEVIEIHAPEPNLSPTPEADQGRLSGASSRPLGVTLLGLSVLCTCALGPVLTIGLVIGVMIHANRQRPLV